MDSEPRPKTRLEQLQDVIIDSPAAIEAEFERTANDWLSCFGSRVFVIETYLSSPKVEELILPEEYKKVLAKLEELKERLLQLKEGYPNKELSPPEDIKQDLLNHLNIFA